MKRLFCDCCSNEIKNVWPVAVDMGMGHTATVNISHHGVTGTTNSDICQKCITLFCQALHERALEIEKAIPEREKENAKHREHFLLITANRPSVES